jgi:hypothetical protein
MIPQGEPGGEFRPIYPGPRPGPGPETATRNTPEMITETITETAESVDAVGTGHPAVDEVLGALSGAEQSPPAEQIAFYEATHRVLKETLATIDQG